KPAGRIGGKACALLARVLISGLIDQSTERRRSAVGLLFEPRPVAGQETDLAGHYAQFRTPRSGPRRLRKGACEDVGRGASQVEIHLPAGLILEYQNKGADASIKARFNLGYHCFEGS